MSLNFHVTFGLVSIPIKLDTGARKNRPSFKRVAPDGGPVTQRYFAKNSGEEIKIGDCKQGFEISEGVLGVIEESEIEKIKPNSSKVIEIQSFVPLASVDPLLFETSYFVSPRDVGEKPYALLYEALETSGKLAIGKATLYGSEHVIGLRAAFGGIVCHTLFYSPEANTTKAHRTDRSMLKDAERELAKRLVDGMSAEAYDPSQYSDTYSETVNALIEAKRNGIDLDGAGVAGQPLKAPDIMELLKLSVEKHGGKIKEVEYRISKEARYETLQELGEEKAKKQRAPRKKPAKVTPETLTPTLDAVLADMDAKGIA